ncbi:uncharacterized protein LOC122304830 [Carya illinoinensis]|uniref:uncharacterized protein LOC122304830 n=1 Tax=Carya illinoinensis TaxID=32201 RepID=UPI001C723D5A|nr:uncharacterized protein LOC122304830 [Carya illinoinensis]
MGTSKRRLKKLMNKYSPGIVAVAEPFLSQRHMESFKQKLQFEGCLSNEVQGGKLWILWAKGAKVERMKLWQSLSNRVRGSTPWLVLGDFNIIRNDLERRGGRPRQYATMEDFNSFIDSTGLSEMKYSGNHLSWCNRHEGASQSWSCLDRVLMSAEVLSIFLEAHLEYLGRSTSDHSPMVIRWNNSSTSYGFPPFKFHQMWVKHEAFMECVAVSWEKGMEERGMARLAKKLKRLKSTLRGWNKEVFGATTLNIRLLEDRVGKLENKMQEGFNEEDEQDYLVAKIELNTWLEREETRLRQQAKLSWLEKGEASPSFFRACNARSKMQVNEMRLPDGRWLKSSEEIHEEAVQYFSHFLAHKQVGVLPDLSNLVQTVVIEEDNERLCQLPSIQDVRDAVFSIPINSSPRPNGFGSGFFQACWHIIGNDVVEAVQEFFLGAYLPINFAASFLTLIPKVESPTNFDKFRPISLCLTFYKICSKILVSRLAPMLPRIIAPEQGAFIPGRSIFDNISLIQELVHSINKPIWGGNIILKLDIAKAYDSVDWNFLLHVMSHFGFSSQVCDLIKMCISNAHFSIVMNGVPKGFFKSGRGLRHGDPISPYLFIMVEEILSKLLKAKFEEKKIGVFVQPRGTPLISHLLYANDIVIFANGSKASARAIMRVLSTYEQWLSQNVSKGKSSITFSRHITRPRRRSIQRITRFVEGKTPFKYLGVPIIFGCMKSAYLEEIVGKIKARLEGWKNKLLANGARVLLLKHVLMSLPIYLLSTVYVPGLVMTSINRCLSNFFWGVQDGKPKKHWKSRDKLCLPVAEGGMGFRKFTDIQKSLFMKFAWKIMVEDSLWSNFFRFDKWLDEGPLCNLVPMGDPPSLQVTEFKMEKGWDVVKLHGILGAELTKKVLEVLSKSRAGADVLVWTASNDGKFSTKSAWNCVRINAPKVRWVDWVWHPCIPKNISVNMWKVFNNALSVDDKIRSIGIPIASKCDCYLNGGYENRDRVLANGDIAKEVWRLAYAQMGLGRTTGISWNRIVEECLTKASKSSQLGHLLRIIPSIVTWSLWLRCCKARAEGIKDSAITVWYNIKTWIAKVGEKLKVGKLLLSRDQKILTELNIPVKPPKRVILKLVRWTKLALGRLKLNVDGSSNGNLGSARAGGVLRDSKGELLMAFSVHLGTGTSNYAEVMSLIHGLRRIKMMGVAHIDLESDSMLVVRWLKASRCEVWYLKEYWEELMELLKEFEFQISHIYWEGNAAADFLARLGAKGMNKQWHSLDIPSNLRRILRMDKHGFPSIKP